jgi:hypothetical protein
MRISKEVLEKLRNELPNGSFTNIRIRLIKKYPERTDLHFTVEYIRKVLSPDFPHKNSYILEEAILLRDELRDESASLEARILS